MTYFGRTRTWYSRLSRWAGVTDITSWSRQSHLSLGSQRTLGSDGTWLSLHALSTLSQIPDALLQYELTNRPDGIELHKIFVDYE